MNSAKEHLQNAYLIEGKQNDSMLSPRDGGEDTKLNHYTRQKNDATVVAVTSWRNSVLENIKDIINEYSLTNTKTDHAASLDSEEKTLLNRISDKVEIIIKKHTSILA